MSFDYCRRNSWVSVYHCIRYRVTPYRLVHPNLYLVRVRLAQGILANPLPESFPTIVSILPNAMSQTPTATSNYQLIFDHALEAYKKKTKKELRSHPLLPKIQACNSPNAVLTVLREQIPAFDQSDSTSSTNDRLSKWLNPTVNVLYAFSGTIGAGINLVSIRPFEVYQFKV